MALNAVTQRPVKISLQAHVTYDDGNVATFSTPTLKADIISSNTAQQLIEDFAVWIATMGMANFQLPKDMREAQTRLQTSIKEMDIPPEKERKPGSTNAALIMPTQVLLTQSFFDNPADSIITAPSYPGVEVMFDIPVLSGSEINPIMDKLKNGDFNFMSPPPPEEPDDDFGAMY